VTEAAAVVVVAVILMAEPAEQHLAETMAHILV
jgi:hypothetical protein